MPGERSNWAITGGILTGRPPAEPHTKIEFAAFTSEYLRSPGEITDWLNLLGEQGWMAFHLEFNTGVTVYVQRPRPKKGESHAG